MKHPRLSILSLLALGLGGCSAASALLGGELTNVLGNVSKLTGQVAQFSGALGGGNITDAVLQQVAGFSGEAGNLLGPLRQAMGGATAQVREQTAGVEDGLGKLAGFKLEDVQPLGQDQRQAKVGDFTSSAADLGAMVKGLLGS